MDILLVDDNSSVRQDLNHFLNQQGHTVVEAQNGLSAFSILQKQSFDFIITDNLMPLMNGVKLAENAIKQKYVSSEQIVVLTTKSDALFTKQLEKLNVNWFAKPIQYGKLLSALNYNKADFVA